MVSLVAGVPLGASWGPAAKVHLPVSVPGSGVSSKLHHLVHNIIYWGPVLVTSTVILTLPLSSSNLHLLWDKSNLLLYLLRSQNNISSVAVQSFGVILANLSSSLVDREHLQYSSGCDLLSSSSDLCQHPGHDLLRLLIVLPARLPGVPQWGDQPSRLSIHLTTHPPPLHPPRPPYLHESDAGNVKHDSGLSERNVETDVIGKFYLVLMSG